MKSKPKILTIILIILALYFLLQSWNYFGDKQDTWVECEKLSEKIIVGNPDNTETWEWWPNWVECNEEYINQFMMLEIMLIFLVLTVIMAILSWKLDGLNKG